MEKLRKKMLKLIGKNIDFLIIECNKSNDKHVKTLVDKINHNYINIMQNILFKKNIFNSHKHIVFK